MTQSPQDVEKTAGHKQARWRCETCKGELTMPAGFSEWGYFCCYASMTFVGVELAHLTQGEPDNGR